MTNSNKLGLVLGSGGARGWAHIGFIKGMIEDNITPQFVTGCSAGALVGAAYVSGNINRLEDWVLGLNWQNIASYFDVGLRSGGLINGDKLIDFFYSEVGTIKFSELKTKFGVVATHFDSGNERVFLRGDVIKSVRASISLPGLFVPYKIGKSYYVDGGLVNPLPVSLCKKIGANKIIAIDLNDYVKGRKTKSEVSPNGDEDSIFYEIKDKFNNYLQTYLKQHRGNIGFYEVISDSIGIMQNTIKNIRLKIDEPDLIVAPKVADINILEFHKGKEAISEGYKCYKRHRSKILESVNNFV